MTIHRSAARLDGAQKQKMSEPHILKLPWSRGTTAPTKGGSLPRTQALACAATRHGVRRAPGQYLPKWDNPTMIATADQKRRVVLPKPVQPGDVLDISVLGERMILQVLKKPTAVPPVTARPLEAEALTFVDLDEPAFMPVSDESPA